MSKQFPSAYVIISTHGGYILPLQLLLGFPDLPMNTNPTEEWIILSHVVLTSNMDWSYSVPNFSEAEYAKNIEWVENVGRWYGTA